MTPPTVTPASAAEPPAEATATTRLTFEQGYARLQAIAERLNEADVPVSEMCDLFAEGKGLERSLTAFLDTQRARVEAIDRGEGVHSFEIAADATPGARGGTTPF
jgi:exodeoxyribonuclease VII small subunit